jgi:riboflavin transporter FmnP
MKTKQGWFTTKRIAAIGVLSAGAALLMLLEIPLFFAPSFYKLDFSEVFVLLGAYAIGPLAGVAIEAVKILLNFALDGTVTAGIGELSNFLIGCALVVPAAFIYRQGKSFKSAFLGLAVGIVSLVAVSGLLNYFILIPVYAKAFGMPLESIVGFGTAINPAITDLKTLILYATVPFNLLKGIIAAAATLLLYKRVERFLNI